MQWCWVASETNPSTTKVHQTSWDKLKLSLRYPLNVLLWSKHFCLYISLTQSSSRPIVRLFLSLYSSIFSAFFFSSFICQHLTMFPFCNPHLSIYTSYPVIKIFVFSFLSQWAESNQEWGGVGAESSWVKGVRGSVKEAGWKASTEQHVTSLKCSLQLSFIINLNVQESDWAQLALHCVLRLLYAKVCDVRVCASMCVTVRHRDRLSRKAWVRS